MLRGLIAEAANQKYAQRQKKFELKERHVRAMERIAAALETSAAIEDKNKKAAACCNKRAADRAKEPAWLDSALLVEFEKKLAQDSDGLFGFLRGEEDGVVPSLRDYDVSFVVDSEFRPQRWLNGECGVHAFTIQVCVRGGKVVSYAVRGRGEYEVFVKILPQDGVVYVATHLADEEGGR